MVAKKSQDTHKQHRKSPTSNSASPLSGKDLRSLIHKVDALSQKIDQQGIAGTRQPDYDAGMVASTKSRKTPPKRSNDAKIRIPMPEGTGVAAVVGRGLIRYVRRLGRTIPEIAQQTGIPETNWYRAVSATGRGQTMIRHIDAICRKLKVDFLDIYRLGIPDEGQSQDDRAA